MQSSRPAARWLLVLLLAWPFAVAAGWAFARLTQTNWPAGAVPTGWFVVLMVAIRRYASSASR